MSIPTFLSLDDKEIKKGYDIKYFDGIETFDIISGNELEKIKDIKKEIETSYKLPKGSYELVFDDIVLNEEKILTNYNIYNVSTIYLIIEQKYEKLLLSNLFKNNFFFWLRYKGKSWTAGLKDLTISGIKKYVKEVIAKNAEIDKMKIVFRGKILDNDLDIKKEGLSGRELQLIIADN